MPSLGQKGPQSVRDAESERWRKFQEEQAEKTAAELARRTHEQDQALLQEAWSISMAVCDEMAAVGDAEDDDEQVEARRRQRLIGMKCRYLEIIEQLRGLDYRAGRRDVIDIALPEALWRVPVDEDHADMLDILPTKPRKATMRAMGDDGRKATDDEVERLRATLAAIDARHRRTRVLS